MNLAAIALAAALLMAVWMIGRYTLTRRLSSIKLVESFPSLLSFFSFLYPRDELPELTWLWTLQAFRRLSQALG